jgi:predicted DNA binding CopG/RHH family protein
MKKQIEMPKFKNESQEADWWASQEGREYLKTRVVEARRNGTKFAGSPLVAALNKSSVQIAIRIPEQDLEQARKIAERKGIGYQTLLKMLVHEGLERESKRA